MKNLIFIFAILISGSAFANQKVLMMIPNDFMWQEYAMPLQAYQDVGFTVTLAGRFKEEMNPDRRNMTKGHALYFSEARSVKVDISFEEVDVNKFDAITFVAGNGAWHDFFPSDVVHKIVLTAHQNNKVLGLLCASTGLIGMAGNYNGEKGFAEGKRVVGYYRVEGLIKNLGKANYISGGRNEPAVEVDGNLVTGRNPESAQIFGEKIVQVLTGRISKK